MSAGQTIAEPSSAPILPLVFEPVVGPPIPPVALDPHKTSVIGRSSTCQVILADESVSRRHAQIHHTSGTWFLTDLGSRHGTHINAIQLAPSGATPMHNGDLVGLGPWTFRVRIGDVAAQSHITGDDKLQEAERVERVQEREMAAITQNRLNLLMNCAAGIAGVGDEAKLAKTIVAAATEGTGFPRAAVLRELHPASNEFDIICFRGPSEARPDSKGLPTQPPSASLSTPGPGPGSAAAAGVRVSTSLINAARSGDLATLKSDAALAGGASIISLGIQTAMCAPISIGGVVTAFLYLDARAGESGGARGFMAGFGAGAGRSTAIQQDAAAFCMALAKMYSLAMSNILREQLAHRQATIEKELAAAREAQRLIMPPDEGVVGGLRYAMRMRSGRYVAGDLFDAIDLGHGRVAVFLGDVAGKGIGAAILMATAQTHLNASLRYHGDPATAVAEVNRYICSHVAQNKFISLWLGVFEPASGHVSFVDAGHGHWLIACEGPPGCTGRQVRKVESIGGLPLGIEHDHPYQTEHFTLGPGDRLVVFSDGVVEQPSPDGVLFGLPRTIEAIRESRNEADDVARVFRAVNDYAQTDALSDDTTVASVGLATPA